MQLIKITYKEIHNITEMQEYFKKCFGNSFADCVPSGNFRNLTVLMSNKTVEIRYGTPLSKEHDTIYVSDSIKFRDIFTAIRDFSYPPSSFECFYRRIPIAFRDKVEKPLENHRVIFSYDCNNPTLKFSIDEVEYPLSEVLQKEFLNKVCLLRG